MAASSISTSSIITFGALFIALVAVIALLYYCIPRASSTASAPASSAAAAAAAAHQKGVPVNTAEEEAFSNYAPVQQNDEVATEVVQAAMESNTSNVGGENIVAVEASEPLGSNETPYPLESGSDSNAPTDPNTCFPKNTQLQPEELLPADANSQWAQVCPAGQGGISDQNFLTAGHHVGINTTGNSLRNANLQLRSEPPNPQTSVGPWNTSTISPDLNRRPLEVGGC